MKIPVITAIVMASQDIVHVNKPEWDVNFWAKWDADKKVVEFGGDWSYVPDMPTEERPSQEQCYAWALKYTETDSEAKREIESCPAWSDKPSGIPCVECGGPVIEFSVPNSLWNLVMRPDGHETDAEYLCFACWNKQLENTLINLMEVCND